MRRGLPGPIPSSSCAVCPISPPGRCCAKGLPCKAPARRRGRATKQFIAVAVAHVTQCPYCINGHTKLAIRKGNTPEEIMEAIWVAAEMRAGGAFAHSTLALDAIEAARPHAMT